MSYANLLLSHGAEFADGLLTTLVVLATGGCLALAGGALLCSARLGRGRIAGPSSAAFIGFFRITPEAILIFWAYFCIPPLFHQAVSGFWAGSVTLGLIGSAYLAEIFRAGIRAVPKGQAEAARALGLHRRAVLWRVVGPQAFRIALPPLVNYFSEFLKNTTLLSAIGVGELSYQAFVLGGQTFRYLDFLSAVALVYFALIFPIGLLSRRLEHRLVH